MIIITEDAKRLSQAALIAPLSIIPLSLILGVLAQELKLPWVSTYGDALYVGGIMVLYAYPVTLLYYLPVFLFIRKYFVRSIGSLFLFLTLASLVSVVVLEFFLGVNNNYEIYFWLFISECISIVVALTFWLLAKPSRQIVQSSETTAD